MKAVLSRLRDATFMPFKESITAFYRHDPPLIGWPEVLLLVFGVAGVVAAALRTRRWFTISWLVVPTLVMIGVLSTVDVVALHRLLLITPLWALAIGVGIVLVARWLGCIPIARLPVGTVQRAVLVGALYVLHSTLLLLWCVIELRLIGSAHVY